MIRPISKLLVTLILLGAAPASIADYLVVRRPASLKTQPSRNAETLVSLSDGDRLLLLDEKQRNGYYHAGGSDSADDGWVYRTFVRRYPGDAPERRKEPLAPRSPSGRTDLDTGLTRSTDVTRDEDAFDHYDPYDANGKWYTYAGVPKADGYPNPITVLRNTGYVVGYDEQRHDPAWACYRCFRFTRSATPARPSWKQDKRTTSHITTGDYENTPFTRGHMAPNYAIFQCYGRTAQLETFLMSNVCPQYQTNNDGIWGDIEDLIANHLAQDDAEVWVTCGPIFKDGAGPATIGHAVQVPEAFFMIVIDEDAGKPRALAFRVRHTNDRGTAPEDYFASIDEIEAATHLDFFAALPDDVENPLEAARAARVWPTPSHN
jgi:endonuclease G